MSAKKLIYPAASRNQAPILAVLAEHIPKHFPDNQSLFAIEIASGSGQHVAHFAPHFPRVTFQPTECSADVLASIAQYADECPTGNIKPPVQFDVREDLGAKLAISPESVDILYCANMIHISPLECTVGLFKNAGAYLKRGGVLVTYGAYAIDGVISPQSNVDFDRSLRSQNGEWGLRCLTTQLSQMAKQYNIVLKSIVDMPANNKCVIWVKD